MDLIQMKVRGISYSETQTGAYALILNEEKGERKLPIIIGGFEAQSIAIALENEVKPSRPLTHDLFKSFGERFNINVKQVIIHKLVDGIFFSSLICERDKIEEIMDQMEQNQGVSVQAPSSADELKKFSDLLKDGLITQDEFDKKKKELLGL